MNIEVPEKASDLCTTLWERHHEKIKQIVHNKGLSDEHKLDAINKIV
jgi:hypothetical protein